MKHLFAYGTLMRDDVLRVVSGCRRRGLPGTLSGYCRRVVSGEDYPGIHPCIGGRVRGVVYRDLPDTAWRRLDRYEGRIYARKPVSIRLSGGGRVWAQVYEIRPACRRRLAAGDWGAGRFLMDDAASGAGGSHRP